MEASHLVAEVARRVRCDDAAQLVDATLQVLAAALDQTARESLALRLAPPHDVPFRARRPAIDIDRDTLYDRVRAHLRMELSLNWEQLAVVCQVLTESIDDVGRFHLRHGLPTVADLFEPRPPASRALLSDPRHVSHAEHAGGGTLATGAPAYSHRPLHTAHGQSGSVVESENPHGDTKLSTSRGSSSERDGSTLADGRPGSSRPLSGHRF